MSCGQCGAPIAPTPTAAAPVAAAPTVAAAAPVPVASGSAKRWSTGQVIALLIGVLAIVGGGVFLGTRLADRSSDDSSGDSAGTSVATSTGGPTSTLPAGMLDPSTLAPGEVLLEPVNSLLAEPFMPTVATGTEAAPTISLPPIPLPTTTAPAPAGQVVLP
ncbi:MAG: hypothetical protein ABMA25_06585, partial [Ilumatobacteraceae bacterium]